MQIRLLEKMKQQGYKETEGWENMTQAEWAAPRDI